MRRKMRIKRQIRHPCQCLKDVPSMVLTTIDLLIDNGDNILWVYCHFISIEIVEKEIKYEHNIIIPSCMQKKKKGGRKTECFPFTKTNCSWAPCVKRKTCRHVFRRSRRRRYISPPSRDAAVRRHRRPAGSIGGRCRRDATTRHRNLNTEPVRRSVGGGRRTRNPHLGTAPPASLIQSQFTEFQRTLSVPVRRPPVTVEVKLVRCVPRLTVSKYYYFTTRTIFLQTPGKKKK